MLKATSSRLVRENLNLEGKRFRFIRMN